MKYSKSNKKSKSKKAKNKKHSILIKSILGINMCAVGLGIYGAYRIYDKYNPIIQGYIVEGQNKLKDVSVKTFDSKNPTILYDKDDNIIKEFKSAKYKYVKSDDVSDYVKDAFISIEDERFYEHGAIDYKGIFRALKTYLTSHGGNVQGGSTITQQLSKNVFLTMNRTLSRKVEEIVIAKELEEKFTKSEILEFYLNNIYFANGCYGIESASQYYFNKSAKDLTLSESAFLAGIPNNPYLYNPKTNIENTLKRRNIILVQMKNLNKISSEQYDEAIKSEIKLDITDDKSIDANLPYAISFAVRNAVDEILKSEGFVFRYQFKDNKDRQEYYENYNKLYEVAQAKFKSGGYSVKTCIDAELQKKLQNIVDSQMKPYSLKDDEGRYKKQASVVTIDNKTGEVVAIVGGRSDSTYNRAFLSPRQPGSIIKPVVSYTPAFERGYVPSTLYNDAPIKNGPVNWYHSYKGYVTLREGLEQSINTIAVRLVDFVGVENSLNYLRDMEFRYLMPEDKNSIIGIGGFTKGTTNVEMASAYSTLERNGEFIEPTNVVEITDTNGKTIYKNNFEETKVYDSGASYLATSCLQSVINNPGATGYRVKMRNYGESQAGKTGTTDGAKDVWFAGYTPYYTTVVWVGDDMPKPQPDMFGGGTPGHIWRDWMEYLHDGLEEIEFTKPSSVYEKNGKLYDTAYNLKNIISARKENENDRINKENYVQNQRLRELVYRTMYHLTDEEEKIREDKFNDELNKSCSDLDNTGTSLEDKAKYNDIFNNLNNLETLLNEIKKPSAYDGAKAKLDDFRYNLNSQYNVVLRLEQKKKEEEEAKKRAEEEAKIKAEEAKRKAEESKKKAQEENIKNKEDEKSKTVDKDNQKKDISNSNDNKRVKNNIDSKNNKTDSNKTQNKKNNEVKDEDKINKKNINKKII